MMRRAIVLSAVMFAAGACGGRDEAPDSVAAASPDETPAPADTSGSGIAPASDSASVRGDTATHASTPGPATPGRGAADTVRGVVRVAGTAADSRVVLRLADGEIAVSGALAPVIGSLQGMELWVQGPISAVAARMLPPREIAATRFAVRAVAGAAALDGTLRDEGGVLVMIGGDGTRTPLDGAPPALREHLGRRIWLTRADDGSVATFGAIGSPEGS